MAIRDIEGMNLKGYTFKVTNNCEEDVNYIIGMDSLEVSGVEYLDYNSIKVSIDNNSSVIYGEQEDIDHIEENDTYTIRDSKKIATSVVKNGQPNEHVVKVWIKSDAPVEEQSRVFSGRMFITGGQNIENDKPLAQVVVSGDISRTKECDYKEENCTEVTGNDVQYNLYDDGRLVVSGLGKIKEFYEYDYDNPLSIYVEMLNKYISENNIELTEEEQALINNGDLFILIPILYNDDDNYASSVGKMIGIEISTVEEWCKMLGDASLIAIAENIISKIDGFPKITDIIIEDGITTIGVGTFAGLAVKNLYMADSVVSIEEKAFNMGGFTENYKFSNNLTYIDDYAFSVLAYTGTLEIPDSVVLTQDYTGQFSPSSITEIILPDNELYTRTETEFFVGMPNLKTIVIPKHITEFIVYNVDDEIMKNITLKFKGPERTIYAYNGQVYDLTQFKEVIWNYTD